MPPGGGADSAGNESGSGTPEEKSGAPGESGAGEGSEQSSATTGEGDLDDAGEQTGQDGEPSFEESAASSSSAAASGADLEALEAILNEELGSFDGQILEEQQNAQRQGGSSGEGAGDDPAGIGDFQRFPGGAEVGTEGSAEQPVSSAAGAPAPTEGQAPVSMDAEAPPPAADDDIVARQLREAAMAEPDPDIRAALWEEYYKYKEGI